MQFNWLAYRRCFDVMNKSCSLLSSLPHSENYLVKWSSSGLVKDIDQLHNLRAVFTVRVYVCPDVCLCLVCSLALVARCLFSHVMRHVGACLQSLYLLSSLRKSPARCMCLQSQSPLSNGSLREEGSACTHWEYFASFGSYCPQEMNLWTQSQRLLNRFVVKSLPLTQTHLQLRSCVGSAGIVHPDIAVPNCAIWL